MATIEDVRRMALSMPEAVEEDGAYFKVGGKMFAWPWLERVHPKRARVPNLGVLNVYIASEMEKQALIGMDSAVFFSDPHFDGYAAIQVRLEAIDEPLLAKLISDSWRFRAPKRLL